MTITTLLAIIWVHFVADFVLQSSAMATKKSSDTRWLLFHIIIYTIPLCLFGVAYAIVNGCIHFLTDFITSRATTALWKRGETHWFFVVIGFDQALHISALTLTYVMFYG